MCIAENEAIWSNMDLRQHHHLAHTGFGQALQTEL